MGYKSKEEWKVLRCLVESDAERLEEVVFDILLLIIQNSFFIGK